VSPWTSEPRWRRRVAALTARWKRAALCHLQRIEDFEAWCASHRGSNCRLIVSTALSHELNFEAGLPLHDEAERLAYARHQFVHYFGAHAPRWQLAVWAGGASALHGLEWPQLQELAQRHQVRLVSVEPAWAAVLRGVGKVETEWARAPQSALVWVEGTQLSWLVLEQGRLKEVRKLRLRDATLSALRDALGGLHAEGRQPVLIAGYSLDETGIVPDARTLGPLNLTAPDLALFEPVERAGSSLPSVNFLGERTRRPVLAWPLLATSLLVLLTAGWSAWQGREAMLESQAQLALLEARMRTHAPATPRPASASGRTADADLDRRAADVQAILTWAWEPVLAGVEELGASSTISWLGMDATAMRSEIRLEGQAPDRMNALRAVDRLGATPGWHHVMLGRLQQADAGQTGQRFDINARLQSAELKLPVPVSASAPLKEGA